MSDATSNTSSTSSDSSSGAPTGSANTQANTPADASANTPASTSTEKTDKAEKTEKKTKRAGGKSKEIKPASKAPDMLAAFAKLVVLAKGYEDPLVDGLLEEGEKSARHLEKEADQVPVDTGELEALRTSSQALKQAFGANLKSLKICLQTVKGGKTFVATHSDPNEVACYRQLAAGMTPAHLGHNRSLFEETEQSFAEYMRIDGDLQVLQAKARAQAARVAEAKRRLVLDLRAIRAAMSLADARKAKYELTHPARAA